MRGVWSRWRLLAGRLAPRFSHRSYSTTSEEPPLQISTARGTSPWATELGCAETRSNVCLPRVGVPGAPKPGPRNPARETIARRPVPPRRRGADRLDPEHGALVVDELAHRGYFPRRSSSAWAKYADAFRRISFARFSSRTSRSNSFNRSRSLVVSPVLSVRLVRRPVVERRVGPAPVVEVHPPADSGTGLGAGRELRQVGIDSGAPGALRRPGPLEERVQGGAPACERPCRPDGGASVSSDASRKTASPKTARQSTA